MMPLRRAAFTFVEMLVVISVIGMLMALLLPAVNSARICSRRVDCANHEMQVAQGALVFQVDVGSFPGYWMPASATKPTGATWPLTLSKYLGRQDIWNAWAGVGSTAPTGIPSTLYWDQMVCPSNPAPNNRGHWLSYVVNCGLSNKDIDGVCFNQLASQTLPTPKTSTDSLQSAKGDSYTLFASENTLGIVTSNSEGWLQTTPAGALQYTGFCWQAVTTPNVAQQINGDKANPNPPMPGTVLSDYARPSSNHPGGVNVVFCDGHIHFLSEKVSYSVYQVLMSSDPTKADFPAGSAAIGYTLKDDDY